MSKKGGNAYTANQALQAWAAAHPDEKLEEVEELGLQATHPPIKVMSDKLAQLANCKKLMISTNNIEDIGFLPPRIEILSIGRNMLRKLDKIDRAAATLQQLWMSYNEVKTLGPLVQCKRLRVLYCSYNKLDKLTELDRLAQLQNLEDLVLVGNPIVETISKTKDYRIEVCKKCKKLTVLDGIQVTDRDRGEEGAKATGDQSSKATGSATAGASGTASEGGSRAQSPRPDSAKGK